MKRCEDNYHENFSSGFINQFIALYSCILKVVTLFKKSHILSNQIFPLSFAVVVVILRGTC